MSEAPSCPDKRPFRVTLAVVRYGTVRIVSLQPWCEQMTCSVCRAVKMQGVASRLARLVPPSGKVFVAKAGAERVNEVKLAFQRAASRAKSDGLDAGRLVVTLDADAHLHVSSVDCLSGVGGRQVDAGRAVLALRSPALPATRSGRWVGDWKLIQDEEGEQVFRLSHDVRGEMRRRFCAAYRLPESVFSNGTEFSGVHDPDFVRLWGAVEWWRVNEMGLAPRMFRGAFIEPIPPVGFVFRDERRTTTDAA